MIFDAKHVIYGFLGAAIFGLGGFLAGVALYVMALSGAGFSVAAGNSPLTTLLVNLISGLGSLPLMFTFGGAALGFFAGFIYSHEKDNAPQKPS